MTQSEKKQAVVLVVDDDEIVRYVIERYLTAANITVCLAASGREGLKLAKKTRPDLILLDIIMPGMDGFEFLAKIKEDQDLQNIPISILSILEHQADREKATKFGVVDYIPKPFNLKEVVEQVKKRLLKG